MQEGTIHFVRCQRCNLSLRIRVQPGNPDALLLRRSQTATGICASCAASLFLHSVDHIRRLLDEKREMLLWQPMQAQFAALMAAGNADADPSEIDWQSVHDTWELPFAGQCTPKRASGKQTRQGDPEVGQHTLFREDEREGNT